MELFYFYLIIGITLIVLEIAFNTFYLLVIGSVFLLSGSLALIVNNNIIIALISVGLSILACILLKIYKQNHKNSDPRIAGHIGKQVEIVEIYHDKLRVKYSGSYWDAKLAKKDIATVKVGDILTITNYHNNEFEIN